MTLESTFLHVITSLGIMLFAVKPIGELFHRIRRQIVLGELLAGIIMVAATTIITLIWLKMAYRKDPSEPATIVQKEET